MAVGQRASLERCVERVAEITEGRAWYQLYHPADSDLGDAIIKGAANTGMPVFVVLADVPIFGFRPRDVRSGLVLPRICFPFSVPGILKVLYPLGFLNRFGFGILGGLANLS